MIPNLFIVGAPKSGTTSLHYYLDEHPDIFMSTPKEINYFSKMDLDKQGIYYKDLKLNSIADYQSLFKYADNKKVVGESSVSYLFYPEVSKKIYDYNPKAKIIAILRNPIERGYSHYLMDLKLGEVKTSFENIIFKNYSIKKLNIYFQQYLELGLYYNQVKRYIDTFGKNQVKVILTEDLNNDIVKTLNEIFYYLDIPNINIPSVKNKYNVNSQPKSNILKKLYSIRSLRFAISSILPTHKKNQVKTLLFTNKNKPIINPKTKDYLLRIYKPDIMKLENLISRDLSSWYAKIDG